MKKSYYFYLSLSLLIIIIFINIGASAKLDGEKSIDDVINKYMSTCGIPGVEAAVAKDGKIIYAKGFGKTPEGTEVTADTPMYIGSVSKALLHFL